MKTCSANEDGRQRFGDRRRVRGTYLMLPVGLIFLKTYNLVQPYCSTSVI